MQRESEVVFFDLDGTILDTIEDIHDALMEMLTEFGFPKFPISITKQYVGDGIKKLVERAVGKDNFRDEHERFFRDQYRTLIVNKTKPFPKILDALENLAENYTMIILSNKSEEMTDYLVRYFKLDRYFLRWYGGDSFSEKKPSPLPVKEIVNKLGLQNSGFFIGDNYTDIECGKNSGLKTVFCRYGYGKLSNLAPDYYIDSPEELLKILV